MNEWLLNLINTNSITVITAASAGIWWVIYRSFSHDAQIKNLGDKIDHVERNLESKIDHLEEKLEQKIDMMIKHLDEKMDRQDNEAKERITRLEKYFDVIMQTQIRKNDEQLKMEF